MTKEELLEKLAYLRKHNWDTEANHGEADDLLLEYINDKDIKKAFEEIEKWYA
jgi:hypothetical protein